MQLKRMRFFLIFHLLGLFTLGCAPGRSPTEILAPFQGTQLRIVCPDAALARRMERQGRSWESRNQARIEVVDGPKIDGLADIQILPAARLPQLIAAKKVQPLPDHLLSIDDPYGWNGLLAIYKDRLLLWGKTAYGFPMVGEAPILAYRGDLLGDPRHKEAFRQKEGRPLEPPQTWGDLRRIASYFAEAGYYGLPRLSDDPADLEQQFYTLAAAYSCRARAPEDIIPTAQRDRVFSFHRDLGTGKPLVNSAGFVHALKLLHELHGFRPKEGGFGPDGFLQGKCVFCLTQAWAASDFQKRQESQVRDRVAFCQVPAGEGWYDLGSTTMTNGFNPMVYLGGETQVASVLTGSTNTKAALDLLVDLTSREVSGQTVIDTRPGSRWAGGAIRIEQLEERCRWDAFDLDADRTTNLKQTVRDTVLLKRVKNPVFCLRVPDQELRQKPLVEAIRRVLAGKQEAGAALDEVAAEWNRLDAVQGLKAALQEYRLSLGFLNQ